MNGLLAYVLAGLLLLQTCSACMQPPANLTAPSSASAIGTFGQNSQVNTSGSPSGSSPPVDAAVLSNAALAGALTTYLKHHKLPLVGANVVTDRDGTRNVILYGFTATDYGKSDAARKTEHFLDDPSIGITNRIVVRPELAQMRGAAEQPQVGSAGNSFGASPLPTLGNVSSYQHQQSFSNSPQQAANQSGGWWDTLLPLVGVAALVAGALAVSGLGGFGGYGGAYPGYGYPGYGLGYPGNP